MNLPLIVIVGPTASGKTGVAVELAEEFGGEIVCADSRTVYKGMDVGTAKPTKEEQERVPHWGIDLVEPGDRFTAADFKQYAQKKIEEIRERGRVPFLVGGTGLYVDAVIYDYQFGNEGDPDWRRELEKLSTVELQQYCIKNSITLPKDRLNRRRLIRAIEQNGMGAKRAEAPFATNIIVGIATDKTELRTRIASRSEQILTNGVVDEAIRLGKKYGWDSEAMTGNIYPLLNSYLKNEQDLKEVEDKFTTLDWRLAKRQLTWFRRDPHVLWLLRDDVARYVRKAIATKGKA